MVHYFTEKQESELRFFPLEATLRGKKLSLLTASGVFGRKKVDRGSELLIQKCIVEDNWDVLDLGCGIGVVGIAIKKCFPKCNVILTDINKRAVKVAKINSRHNKVEVKIKQGDMYAKITGEFDTILLNPPQHAGKDVCMKMIENESLVVHPYPVRAFANTILLDVPESKIYSFMV